MKRALVILAPVTVLILGFTAVRDHVALVRAGYRLSSLESSRESLEATTAVVRARVSRLTSPACLAERARDAGLATEYPANYPVVRLATGSRESEPVLASNR